MNNIEELTSQLLEKYFSDFKEYHLFILIGFTVAIALIQIFQSVWVSKRIERFKNDLKKSEIKFSRYNQIQIEALSKIYETLTDFLNHTYVIKNKIKSSSPERTSLVTKEWLNSYSNVYSIFTKKRYILPISIKKELSSIIVILNKMKIYIENKKDLSAMYHTWDNGEIELMGDYQEMMILHEKMNKYDEDGVIDKTIESIISIKNEIEEYFESIE